MKAIIDLETGGFDKSNNAIMEVAILVFEKQNIISEYETLIKPYKNKTYVDRALEVNGLTVEQCEADGIDSKEAAVQIVEFLKANNIDTLIGHNIISFDIPYLNIFLQEHGLDPVMFTHIDTQRIARGNGYKKYGLENVARTLGIEIPEVRHRALEDCRLNLEVFRAMHLSVDQ